MLLNVKWCYTYKQAYSDAISNIATVAGMIDSLLPPSITKELKDAVSSAAVRLVH